MRLLVAMLFVSTAAPAIAQDHSGHAMPSAQSPAQTECEKEAERHRAMGHSVPEGACAPKAQPTEPAQDGHTGMDHSQMDHSQMDHSQMQGMDHSTMDHSKMEGMDIPRWAIKTRSNPNRQPWITVRWGTVPWT